MPLLLSLLSRARDFAVAHWRTLVVVTAVAALILDHTCSKPKVVTKTETRVEYRDRVVEKRVEVAAQQTAATEQKVITRDRIVTVHGQCEEHTTVTIGRQEQTASQTQTAQHVEIQRVATETAKATQAVTPYVPQWHAGVLAGLELRHIDDAQPLGPVAFGAEVQRRVLGPVWVGAWGVSSGTVGLSLSAEF